MSNTTGLTVKTFVTTTHAHPNNVYRIREIGEGWVLLDDRTTMGLSVDTESVTVHTECGSKWCHACTYATVSPITREVMYFNRNTGVQIMDAYDKLKSTLEGHKVPADDITEILKDVDRTDTKTIETLQFFADRIVK